jgi:biotin synthase-related radical SAM superfamily protein
MNDKTHLPNHVRVSAGSAIVLGLLNSKLDAPPTTVYLMTYKRGKCSANCGFCPQARGSQSRTDMLSRVSWPIYLTKHVINRIDRAFKEAKAERVCIQALNYPQVFFHLQALVNAIHKQSCIPISVSCQPLQRKNIVHLAEAGIERIGIPVDAATEEIFTRIKGSSTGGFYSWKDQWKLLDEAVGVFGKGKVSTHLIVGLGETEKHMIKTLQQCVDMTVLPGLFAFTPIPGTGLANESQPPIEKYRRIQVARYLIMQGTARYEDMSFDEKEDLSEFGVDDQILLQVVEKGEAFLTSGCPDCNRPYYNEKPRGLMYNYPKKLSPDDVSSIKKQLGVL